MPSRSENALLRLPKGRPPGNQVRQTAAGADIEVVADPAVDCEALAHSIHAGLLDAGLGEPVVRVTRVDSLARNPVTGKLTSFVPLGPHAPPSARGGP